jgi:Domain of unknown function (DUF4136)
MKHHQPLALLFIALISFGCEPSLKVSSDFDKSADFTRYKTFSLYKAENINEQISQLNQDRIKNAIRSEMVKKGFQETNSSPDLLVNPVAIFKDKVAVSSTTNYYGYGGVYRPYYYSGFGGGYGTTSYNVDHYKDGSLIIDIVDAATEKLLWQGIGNREIDGPVKDPDTRIPQAIASIMADFPPGMGKKK